MNAFFDSVSKFGKKALTSIKADSPAILTAMGIAGFVVTVISVAKESPKAVQAVKEFEEKKEEPATVAEKVTVSSKYYWKPALTGAAAIACFIGANRISAIRMAGYQAALTSAQKYIDEYRGKTKELYGEKKEKAVTTAISQDKLNSTPVPDIVTQGKGGSTLCYDEIAGRYFMSDYQTLIDAMNRVNYMMNADNGMATLNDFYNEINLPEVEFGDDYVWKISDGSGLLDLDLSDSLVARNGQPALIVKWRHNPQYDGRANW